MEVLPINLLSFIQEAEKDHVPWLWAVTVPGQLRVWRLMTCTSSLNMVEFILTPWMLFNLTWPFNARVLRWLPRLEVLMFQCLLEFPHLPECVILDTWLRRLGPSQACNLPVLFPFLNNLTLDLFSLHVTPGACICTSHRKAAHILLTTQRHSGWSAASAQFLEESFLVGALLISSIEVQVSRVNALLFILLWITSSAQKDT